MSPPTIGTATLVENYPDLVLGDRVLDYGLDILRSEANQIILMSGGATNYGDALAMMLGDNPASFGAPGPDGETRPALSVTRTAGCARRRSSPPRRGA